MLSLKSLKSDINTLVEVFTNDHERFRVLKISAEQLTCRFIGEKGKMHDVHAMIPDLYPSKSLVWYADDDDANDITDIVDQLNETHQNKSVSDQINILLRELCHLHKVEMTKELMASCCGESSSAGQTECPSAPSNEDPVEAAEQDQEGDSDCDEVEFFQVDTFQDELVFSEEEEETETEPSIKKAILKLEKTGSSNTTNRLMKELREIYRSESYKNGEYSVNLVDDSIYEWEVDLRSIDKDSKLYKDLKKLKEKEGKDCITLNMTFNDKYPIEPPFVRVVHPVLLCKHVVGGGAICTELLLKQCWTPAYTVETVIVQLAALFVEGNARINFSANFKTKYSLSAAKSGFREVTGAKSSGWFDRFKETS